MTTANCYQAKAQATRTRRQAAGKYPTQDQKDAMRALISMGEKYLNAAAFEQLASHPHLTVSQRERFAQLAQAAA